MRDSPSPYAGAASSSSTPSPGKNGDQKPFLVLDSHHQSIKVDQTLTSSSNFSSSSSSSTPSSSATLSASSPSPLSPAAAGPPKSVPAPFTPPSSSASFLSPSSFPPHLAAGIPFDSNHPMFRGGGNGGGASAAATAAAISAAHHHIQYFTAAAAAAVTGHPTPHPFLTPPGLAAHIYGAGAATGIVATAATNGGPSPPGAVSPGIVTLGDNKNPPEKSAAAAAVVAGVPISGAVVPNGIAAPNPNSVIERI